ncbi:MAG: MobF family relaxase [Micrococcaceae bacterium]
MTVSISKMSIAYYLNSATVATGDTEHTGQHLTGYYTEAKAPAGRWYGAGLSALSLNAGDTVDRTDAIAVYEKAMDPATKRPLGRAPITATDAPENAQTPAGRTAKPTREPVAGFDLTFSVPKSVSTLWAMAGPDLQARIQDAHHQALEETMNWVENNIIQSRAGHAGVAHVPVRGVVASLFDHWDSRNGDPQLHTHVVISNRVQRLMDDQWATLDSYTLHRHVVAISETYNSLLFDRLHTHVGALPESRDHDGPDLTEALTQAATEDLDADTISQARHRVELAGVPDSLIEEFSTRAQEIEARKNELVAEWEADHDRTAPAAIVLQLRQRATLETRQAKSAENVTLAQKMVTWRSRALDGGQSPADIVAAATGHPDTTITPDMLTDTATDTIAEWALLDTSTRRTTFTRANVTASAQRITRLVRFNTVEDRLAFTDQLVDQALAKSVSLTPQRGIIPDTDDPVVANHGRSVFDHGHTSGIYTTNQIISDEQFLMDRTQPGHLSGLDHQWLTKRIESLTTKDGHPLGTDQAAAVRTVLSSTAGIDAVIGPAGTGKTTTMSAVSALWEETHGPSTVIGLAPSAVAAGVLGDELGVSTENTSKWIYESVGDGAARRAQHITRLTNRLEHLQTQTESDDRTRQLEATTAKLAAQYAAQARYTLREDQLLIIDEASMVSTAQLAELSRQAEHAGAKVLLVGDPAQLEAIDAGGFLGWMDRKTSPAHLDQVWRFRNEWEREASLQLRKGNTNVLTTYDDQGRIHGDPEIDAADNAYQAWLADTRAGRTSILIAQTNSTVTELNTRAQTELVATGQVDIESTANLRGDVFAGVGDKLLARRNNRNLRDDTGTFIANGTQLQITAIEADGSAQATNLTTGGEVTLDPDYLTESVELGYATTAHRSQGVTVDTSHTIVSHDQFRELFYVSMTRGRQENHAYFDLDTDPETHSPDEWGILTETPGPDHRLDALKGVLENSQAEKTAHERAASEKAWANDLGRMIHEYEYLHWAEKSTRTHNWIRQHYGADTDTATRLTQAETWPILVAADPALTHRGTIDESDTVDTITRDCTRQHRTDFIGDIEHQRADREPSTADLQASITAEMNRRVAALESDPPGWLIELEETHQTPDHRQEVLRRIVAWRAVSDQTEATSMLGRSPSPEDSKVISAYYDHARTALADSDPKPSEASVFHDELVEQLTHSRIDVSPLVVPTSAPGSAEFAAKNKPGPAIDHYPSLD